MQAWAALATVLEIRKGLLNFTWEKMKQERVGGDMVKDNNGQNPGGFRFRDFFLKKGVRLKKGEVNSVHLNFTLGTSVASREKGSEHRNIQNQGK